MKEIITILGKTTPVFDENLKQPLLCTAGINEFGEWRRLYPVPIDKYDYFRNWNIVEVDLLPKGQQLPSSKHRDNRSESRVINMKVKDPFKVISKIEKHNDKFEIIKKIINPSIKWLKEQKGPRRTLGLIKPKIIKIEIKRSKYKPKEPEISSTHSLLEYMDPTTVANEKRRKSLEKKLRAYSIRIFDIHFYYKCEFDLDCKGHKPQVLDDNLHQYIRNESKKTGSIEELKRKTMKAIQYWHKISHIFLGVGTLSDRPTKYTIGSVLRIGKSKISEERLKELDPFKQRETKGKKQKGLNHFL